MATKNEKAKPAAFTFATSSTSQAAPAELFQQTSPVVQEPEIIPAPPAQLTEQPPKPAVKIGRPKGVAKVKKTFYLTTGVDNLKSAQVELVKQAGLFIKDESEVADLALAVLASAVNDPAKVQEIITVYYQQIKK